MGGPYMSDLFPRVPIQISASVNTSNDTYYLLGRSGVKCPLGILRPNRWWTSPLRMVKKAMRRRKPTGQAFMTLLTLWCEMDAKWMRNNENLWSVKTLFWFWNAWSIKTHTLSSQLYVMKFQVIRTHLWYSACIMEIAWLNFWQELCPIKYRLHAERLIGRKSS